MSQLEQHPDPSQPGYSQTSPPTPPRTASSLPTTSDFQVPLLSRKFSAQSSEDPPSSLTSQMAPRPGQPPAGIAQSTPDNSAPSTPSTNPYQPPTASTFCGDPQNDSRNTPAMAPWKYVGYRIFSKWLASDGAFLMVRRFGALNARIALSMQDEIVQLEEELDDIDEALSKKEIDREINNGCFRNDPWNDRNELVKKRIPEALTKYNAFINGYSQLVNRPAIHKDDLATVKAWMLDLNPKAIDLEEAKFINCDDDLIGIQPKARSWFRQMLEATFVLRTPGVRNFFERKPKEYQIMQEATKSEMKREMAWPNDERVEKLSSIIIAFLGLGMLVGPLWWLAFVHGIIHRLAIITGFIAFFFILVHVATDAGIFNSLAAAAAYSAVLMVFLQVVVVV